MTVLPAWADKLLRLCGQDFDDVTEYQLLIRCLSEQTVVDEAVSRLKTKEDGGMDSSVLQNPSDPDAAYREKAGKQYQVYVADVDESVGENGSVITDYQLEPNNYSDSRFLKDSLERNGVFEEESTAITGIEVPDIYADFKLNEKGTRVLQCPAGHTPKSSGFHLLARIRNGVETVPSILRRIYHADRMPVRGCIRSRFYFGCKIAAASQIPSVCYNKQAAIWH